jgi:hypothetical protein
VEKTYYGTQEVLVLQYSPTLAQIDSDKGPYWVRRDQISTAPSRTNRKERGSRLGGGAEKRKAVLNRLVNSPAAHAAAAWILKNEPNIHVSISTRDRENGEAENFIISNVADVRDEDISYPSEKTQGSSYTIRVGGTPTDEVKAWFKSIDVGAEPTFGKGATIQKWGFVIDFFMVELGIGFAHDVDVQSVVYRIKNEACRDAFVREYNGAY